MPPPVPKPSDPPDLPGSIVPLSPSEETVLSFFNLEGAALAIRETGFSQEELIRKLINHARDSDPQISSRGISQYLRYLTQLATLSGRISTARIARSTTDDDGTTTVESVSAPTLTHRVPTTPRPTHSPGGSTFHAPSPLTAPPTPEPPPPLAS